MQPGETAQRGRRRKRALATGATLILLAGAGTAVTVAETSGSGVSAGGVPGAGSSSTRGPHGLEVLPFPGTPDASPISPIVFPALKPSEVRSVTVTGSSSGRHGGRLTTLPGGRGTAFAAARPFSPGERVSVAARLSSLAAGTASGVSGKTELHFSFKVARPGSGPAKAASGIAGSGQIKPPTPSFHSEPFHPPVVRVTSDADTDSGDVFLTAQDAPQQGPMIINDKGQLVWFVPIEHKTHSAFDLRVQRYDGKPVLTYWIGRVVNGYGTEGEDVILDNHYQRVAVLHAGEGYSSDLHELQLTAQGTALVTVYAPVKADLSSVGGPANGTVLDGIVQEIDVKTGRVVWEWHALGHVPISASESGKPQRGRPYDYFHINSIQQLPDGNLLISARNTWALYEVSRATGKVIWTLGGKDSDFKMGKHTNFEWQHDARLHRNGTLTLFDDAANPKEERQSRALALKLDQTRMRASLERAYTHVPSLLAIAEGSIQILPNGDVFVGWGNKPHFTEYTPAGKQIFGGRFNRPVQSYRVYRFTWNADPSTPPAITASTGDNGQVTVYASWNGATNVARWQLLAGPTKTTLSTLKTVPSAGFETAIEATTDQSYVAVRALDAAGHALATSPPIAR